jgi:hypothetical protein
MIPRTQVEATYDRKRTPGSFANLYADVLFLYYLIQCLKVRRRA